MAMIRPGTEMKDSGIKWVGLMPVNWKTFRIKNLPNQEENSFVDGDWIESSYITDSGIRYYTTGNIGDGKFKEQGNGYISENTFNELKCKYAFPGDLVLSRLNEPYGRSCIIPETEPKCIVAVDNVILRTNEDKRYICYITQCDGYHAEVGELARGTAMKRVSRTNLGTIRIPLPAKIEQQSIADYLDETCSKIDEIIAEAKASIDEYKELKQSVIFEAVTKGLDKNVEMKDSGYDFIGCIPSEWEMCKVRHLGTAQNGISIGGDAFGSGHPFVSYGDVYKNYSLPKAVDKLVQSSEEDRKRYSVEKGDWFFTRTSETIEEVGFSCVCEETIPDAVFAGFLIRVRPFNNRIYTGFAKYYFRSNHLRTFFVKEMNLVTRASLAQGLLKDAPVVVPPYDEQIEIANYLENKCEIIDGVIKDKESTINDLEAYKKSLIYEVVTGKRRVV